MQPTDFAGTFSDGLFPYLWWMIPLAAAAYLSKNMLVRRFCGRPSTNQTQWRLNDGRYHEFERLDVCSGGMHDQIDYVYVSRFGIFVVAVPECRGRILGESGKAFWTEDYHNEKKEFPNPLLKNQLHIRALSQQLGLSPRVFYSVVVVSGNCHFQQVMPDNVLETADFAGYIAQYDEEVLDEAEVEKIRLVLEVNEFNVVFDRTGFDRQAWGM